METAENSLAAVPNCAMGGNQLCGIDLERGSRIGGDIEANLKAIDSTRLSEQQAAHLVRRASSGFGQDAVDHRS